MTRERLVAVTGAHRNGISGALASLSARGLISVNGSSGTMKVTFLAGSTAPKLLGSGAQEPGTDAQNKCTGAQDLCMDDDPEMHKKSASVHKICASEEPLARAVTLTHAHTRESQKQDQDQDPSQKQVQDPSQKDQEQKNTKTVGQAPPPVSEISSPPKVPEHASKKSSKASQTALALVRQDTPATQSVTLDATFESIPAATEDDPSTSSAARLHALWQRVTGRHGFGLTKDRVKSWNQVLTKAGSMTRALAAIRGMGLSDWHMGRKPDDPEMRVSTKFILSNLDDWADAGLAVPDGAMVAPDETRGLGWERVSNEMLTRFERARDDLMQQAHHAIDAGALQPIPPEELAAFSPHALPLGKFPFEGFTATVFPDGPTGTWYLMYIHSSNFTAARVAAAEMCHAYPASESLRLMTTQFVSMYRIERLRQYAATVRELTKWPERERYSDSEIVDAEFDVLGGV